MRITVLVAAFAALLVVACPKTEIFTRCDDPAHPCPPVSPDYPPAGGIVEVFPDDSAEALSSPCGRACANLRTIGCSDGQPLHVPVDGGTATVTCYRACTRMASQQRVAVGCWARAKSVEAARACGGIRCL